MFHDRWTGIPDIEHHVARDAIIAALGKRRVLIESDWQGLPCISLGMGEETKGNRLLPMIDRDNETLEELQAENACSWRSPGALVMRR
jgi:hypothetical protein